VVFFVVIPNYVGSRDLQSQIEAKEKELKDKQEHFANVQNISDNLVQYEEFLYKIEKALPQKVSLASLLSFFQDRAAGSGLIMENLSPSQDVQRTSSQSVEDESEGKTTGINETVFRLTVSGSFPAFESFLRTLENSSRLIEVSSVGFEAGEQREGEGDGGEEEDEEEAVIEFEFDLALKVYSYSDSK